MIIIFVSIGWREAGLIMPVVCELACGTFYAVESLVCN
jgi:hypothetical protein